MVTVTVKNKQTAIQAKGSLLDVTIEAMMTGLPVVAIGELGTVDVMQGDHGGFMVQDDVSVFAEKVCALLSSAALRKQKSDEAKKWGEQWKISSLTPKLVACYEKARSLYYHKEEHDDKA